MDIKMHEAGLAWSNLGSMLSMDSGTQLMAIMLKANSDENKIIAYNRLYVILRINACCDIVRCCR